MSGSELVLRTGYFAKAQQYADAGFALVSIALKPAWFLPKHLRLFQLRHLCPTEELLAMKDGPAAYELKYRSVILSRYKAESMLARFRLIAQEFNTNKIVLLCWEAPPKFCHRHIVANWLTENAGVKICEFSGEDLA